MSVTVQIEGLKDALDLLKGKSIAVQDKAISKGLDKAAAHVAKIARGKAPKSAKPHYQKIGGKSVKIEPGNLKKSIMKLPGIKGSKENQVRVVAPRMGRKAKNDGWYAHLVEGGTVHSQAQPFMEPAYEESKAEAVRIMTEEIVNVLR